MTVKECIRDWLKIKEDEEIRLDILINRTKQD